MPSRKKAIPSLSEESIAGYLTAELDSLTQRALHFEQTLANKINFYLAVVTAIAGGLILATQSDSLREYVLPVAILVTFFLQIMGWLTLGQGLEVTYMAIAMYRRCGRVRHWFVDHDPSLVPYVPFRPGDDRPLFYANYSPLRNIESVLLLVNSAVTGISVVLIFVFLKRTFPQSPLFASWAGYLFALLLGLLCAFLVWTLETAYVRRFMDRKNRQELSAGSVHFPSGLPPLTK